MTADATMMHTTHRHQTHHRCVRCRRLMKSQVTAAVRRPGMLSTPRGRTLRRRQHVFTRPVECCIRCNSAYLRRGDERVPQRVRADFLVIRAWRSTLRTIRPAPCRSSRRPSAVRNMGPSQAVLGGQVDRSGSAGCDRDGDNFALTGDRQVRCPRSRPRCSMSAPVASDTRRPFSASSEISACSGGGPSPAATSMAPRS